MAASPPPCCPARHAVKLEVLSTRLAVPVAITHPPSTLALFPSICTPASRTGDDPTSIPPPDSPATLYSNLQPSQSVSACDCTESPPPEIAA
eukprot:2797154-Rhodomonas_salina.1